MPNASRVATKPGDLIEYIIDNNTTSTQEFYPGLSFHYLGVIEAGHKASPLSWPEGAVTQLRFHAIERKYEPSDVPSSITMRVEGCCAQATCMNVGVGLGARSTPTVEGGFLDWTSPQIQDALARDYLKVCTRVMIAPGQCKTIPMPADLKGQTFEQLSKSLRAAIFKITIGPKCKLRLYIQFNLVGGGCTYLCGR